MRIKASTVFRHVALLLSGLAAVGCQSPQSPSYSTIEISAFNDVIKHWNDQHHDDQQGRYQPHQITQIADNILVYQRANGGWPENKNPLRILTQAELVQQATLKNATDTSFDNRNVYPQIRYLADVYQQTGIVKYKQAAIAGLNFILTAQLDNGGFTHSPPLNNGYRGHITIMDDVMAGVLGLLLEIKQGSARFDFIPDALRQRIRIAHRKGDELLLKLQVRIGHTPTIWAGQYDAETLQPTQGRAFELASVVSRESVDVVRYLMQDDNPTAEKIAAIKAAVQWFEQAKLTGIDMIRVDAEPVRYKYHSSDWDRIIVDAPAAEPIWARFYDIDTNQPLLANREGKRVATLADISRERRTGYDWYGRWPAALLTKDYPRWLNTLPKHLHNQGL
ncbi:pectate lyase [Alteromonas gilva]|uniref:Pectate lyase n=1 Tax=Alteromonas gilva TaxID=2987522 RepID=A0ABT5KZJ4_9ALTE|nr:pectate lyase [Alteromonas gilva]MDC8829626.1 pectate lyase [Alteromonas gilva]